MTQRFYWSLIAIGPAGLLGVPTALGAGNVTLVDGLAEVWDDSTCHLTTTRIFYNFSDPTVVRTGSLGSQGWSSLNWKVNFGQALLNASAGSTAGNNGAFCNDSGGFYPIHGDGHASFQLRFRVAQDCYFTSTGIFPPIENVLHARGHLSPGTYRIAHSISGVNGGFATTVSIKCLGDLSGDSLVDDADFVAFVRAYDIVSCTGPAMPAECPADFDGDGVVDDSDFVLFAASYDALVCP